MTRNGREQVPAYFAPETWFEVKAEPATPFRAAQETTLERLKTRLLQQLLAETPEAQLNAPLRRAANEAAALAWATPFPLLFLPALLEETALAARRQAEHQARVLQRCRASQGVAA